MSDTELKIEMAYLIWGTDLQRKWKWISKRTEYVELTHDRDGKQLYEKIEIPIPDVELMLQDIKKKRWAFNLGYNPILEDLYIFIFKCWMPEDKHNTKCQGGL